MWNWAWLFLVAQWLAVADTFSFVSLFVCLKSRNRRVWALLHSHKAWVHRGAERYSRTLVGWRIVLDREGSGDGLNDYRRVVLEFSELIQITFAAKIFGVLVLVDPVHLAGHDSLSLFFSRPSNGTQIWVDMDSFKQVLGSWWLLADLLAVCNLWLTIKVIKRWNLKACLRKLLKAAKIDLRSY